MFYTYLWLREDGTPYYVGKGHGDRAYKYHRRHGSPPKQRVVIYQAESEVDAFETEIALIWYYGRKDLGTGCLRNLTNGGEGTSGTPATPKCIAVATKFMTKSNTDPEFISKRLEGMRKLWADPVFIAANSKRSRAINADSKFREIQRKAVVKLHKDPTFVANRLAHVHEANHIRWHVKRDIVKEGCEFCKEKSWQP